MFKLLRKRPPLADRWHESSLLIQFSRRDPFTIGDALQGISVLGGTGSGKTTASGFQMAHAMLKCGFGGLVLTVKLDEVDRWRRLCADTGRQDDLIVFDEDCGHRFSFLNNGSSHQINRAGQTEATVNIFEEMIEVSSRQSTRGAPRADEQFWISSRKRLLRNVVDLIAIATEHVTIERILEVLQDVPRSKDAFKNADFSTSNLVGFLVHRAAEVAESEREKHDVAQISQYLTVSFPCLAEKTRSVIEESLWSVLDLFSRGALYELFGTKTTVEPSEIINGKIVVVNLPLKRWGATGLVGQTIWKAKTQERLETRSCHETRPCFIYIDEAQNFFTIRDMHFAATARSSLCSNIWLTQNISNVYVAMGGGEEAKAATDSILGLAQTKVFHQNSDPVTNQWAADLIGRRRLRMRSMSVVPSKQNMMAIFPEESQVTSSFSESFEYVVQPHIFAELRKGGREHGFSEAIIFQGGRRWHGSRETFMRVPIKQGY